MLAALALVLVCAVPAAAQLPSPGISPPGANDWSCKPTARRPRPVILVHGTFGDRQHLWEPMSLRLSRAGYCVFSLGYGNRATGPIQDSAKQLAAFTTRVLRATGARKVSMVGHSQGGMMPRYYIKNLGGARYVDDLIGLAPSHHGTTVVNSAMFDGTRDSDYSCRACEQQVAGSPFLRALNSGDETPGAVDYTNVVTRYDEVVVPYTSGYLAPDDDVTNVALQDRCPTDTSDHLRVPYDPPAISLTLNALGRSGPADPAYQPPC